MKYISIDGEFSGLDHTKYELISIGMCDCSDLDDNFYIEIQPTKPMDPEATKIHKLSEQYLKENGKNRKTAAHLIHRWLSRRKTDQLIFVGYPVVLDWIFLDQLFKEFGLENPFYYEQIDIHTMGLCLLNLEPGFGHELLRTKLKLGEMKNKHNALADAKHQAEEFVALANLMRNNLI